MTEDEASGTEEPAATAPEDGPPDLSTVGGFDSLGRNDGKVAKIAAGSVYCARCGAVRLADAVHVVTVDHISRWSRRTSLFFLTCRQCHARFTLLRFMSANGPEVACLPTVNGGLSTPRAPKEVTYYLDQAHRAQCMGARSAAVAMFRAALEQLLFEQGFKNGMLNQQITELEAAIKAGTAPKWALELETEYLTIIKELGNGAIHKNDGDITKQAALDAALVSAVETVFAALLLHVYEAKHERDQQLARLRAATALLKK